MKLPDMFTPLRNRDYAAFFAVQILSLTGSWAARTALAFVALRMTGSAATLGVMVAMFAIPMVLASPFAGAITDRGNRRLLLVTTSVVAALIASLAALLQGANAMELWHVYAMYIALGVVYALDQPTADAITADLNQGPDMRNAAALNQMAQGMGRLAGSLIAGLLLQLVGPAAVFWYDAITFVPVAVAMLLLKKLPQVRKPAAGGNLLRDYGEGMRYAWNSPRVLDILVCCFVGSIFGFVGLTLYPAFVQYTLKGTGGDLGLFQASVGAGALLASFAVIPWLIKQPRSGMLLLLLLSGGGALLMTMGLFARSLLPAAGLAALGAINGYSYGAIAFGLLGGLTAPDKRGRVFSLFQLALIGSQVPGALLSGLLAEAFGPAMALAVHGGVLLLFGALMFVLRPALVAWRHAPS